MAMLTYPMSARLVFLELPDGIVQAQLNSSCNCFCLFSEDSEQEIYIFLFGVFS
jgi:hypothetical protein